MDANELGRPLPHVVAWSDAVNTWHDRANFESVVLQPERQVPSSVRFASGFSPSRDNIVTKFFVTSARRNELPRRVMTVFVKNRAATGPQYARDFLHEKGWVGNKAKHPATPAEVERSRRQIVIHQIEFMDFEIRQSAGTD